jgi:hypothetical protein
MLATIGLLWLAGQTSPAGIVTALLITAIGTAASDVIVDAIMVESGKRTGLTARFQSVQWLWINIASIFSHLIGGQLATHFKPGTALHIAAVMTLVAPIGVMVTSWLIVREDRSTIALGEMRETARNLAEAFKSRTLWLVIAFLGFWNFSPSFGTPWYYHQTDTLEFTQDFIGVLGAVASAGAVLGSFAYWQLFSKMPLRRQLIIAIATGTVGTLLYVLLLTPTAMTTYLAIVIDFILGAASMVALLATLTLAAQACPPKSEGGTDVGAERLHAALGHHRRASLHRRLRQAHVAADPHLRSLHGGVLPAAADPARPQYRSGARRRAVGRGSRP